MKRIIIVTLVFYLVIYICNKYPNKDKLVLSFGNNINGNYNYYYNNTRITDIINDIKYNKKIDNRNIQNILVKSSIIYLDLNNLFYDTNYDTIKTNLSDLNTLINLIKKYFNGKINIILLKGKNELTDYANQKVMINYKKYDIMFLRWKNGKYS